MAIPVMDFPGFAQKLDEADFFLDVHWTKMF